MLLLFGNISDVEEGKHALRKETDIADGENEESFITTSPLDYHLFRQEITSKYPAYSPPQPLVPIEPENNSILPPLPNHPSRQASQENIHASIAPSTNGGGSILNQPVHIATPAPSPPPTPGGPGGKGGKKQNYQTNQNFPFLYPPLDSTSNTVGGKGSAELQDQLVGKRWDGGDVPASIREAGQLFASRMRMSRSIRQLWDVREQYIKYERGWNDSAKDGEGSDVEGSETRSEDGELEAETEIAEIEAEFKHETAKDEKETTNEAVQSSLDAVMEYYVGIACGIGDSKTEYISSMTLYQISNRWPLFSGRSCSKLYLPLWHSMVRMGFQITASPKTKTRIMRTTHRESARPIPIHQPA